MLETKCDILLSTFPFRLNLRRYNTGQTEVTHAVFEHLIGMKEDAGGGIDVLLHTGDLSYADGFPPRW